MRKEESGGGKAPGGRKEAVGGWWEDDEARASCLCAAKDQSGSHTRVPLSINMSGASCFHFGFFLATIVAATYATNVLECRSTPIDVQNKVNISACDNPPCRLRRKTVPKIELAFTPDHDIKNLRTSVHAVIAGIPFPFLGVDGTSACGKVFMPDGKTKADCPLKKGQDYLYVNSFKVLEQYPKIKVLIHWALTDPNANKVVSCFELPARITS